MQADPVAEQRDSSTDGFGSQAKIPLSLGGSQHFAAMGAERIVSVSEACQLMLLLSALVISSFSAVLANGRDQPHAGRVQVVLLCRVAGKSCRS